MSTQNTPQKRALSDSSMTHIVLLVRPLKKIYTGHCTILKVRRFAVNLGIKKAVSEWQLVDTPTLEYACFAELPPECSVSVF